MHSSLSWMDGVSVVSIAAAIGHLVPTVLATMGALLGCVWYICMLHDWFMRRKCPVCKGKDE